MLFILISLEVTTLNLQKRVSGTVVTIFLGTDETFQPTPTNFLFLFQMPRIRVRTTTRGHNDIYQYKEAYEDLKNGISLRNVLFRNVFLRKFSFFLFVAEDQLHFVYVKFLLFSSFFFYINILSLISFIPSEEELILLC